MKATNSRLSKCLGYAAVLALVLCLQPSARADDDVDGMDVCMKMLAPQTKAECMVYVKNKIFDSKGAKFCRDQMLADEWKLTCLETMNGRIVKEKWMTNCGYPNFLSEAEKIGCVKNYLGMN